MPKMDGWEFLEEYEGTVRYKCCTPPFEKLGINKTEFINRLKS